MTDPTEEEFTNDEEILDEEEEATASEGSSNRTFIFVAIGLGALFLCGVVAVVGYLLVFAPSQSAARQTQVAAIAATNAQVAIDAQNTANPPTPTETPTLPPLLPLVVTNTPVLAATELPTLAAATITPGPSPTPSRTPTRIGGAATGTPGIGGGGVDTRTPTRIVSLSTATPTGTRPTLAPAAATAAAGTAAAGIGGGAVDLTRTPTGLPETGFAEDVGIPTMIIVAVLLIGIVIIARQLRTRSA